MESLSRWSNNLGSTVFIHITCVVPFCAKHDDSTVCRHTQTASNQTVVVPMSSPHHTRKKIMNKISKAIIPYICFKTKQREELSPYNSNKIMKKISKAIQYQLCLKIKQREEDRCLWKKTILMGEKCQPLEFSGAIFYDSKGNQLLEPPRSPRSPRSPRTDPLFSFGQPLIVPKRGQIDV